MLNNVTVPSNAVVLQNKGFKVRVHKVTCTTPGDDKTPRKYERVLDENGDPQYDEIWFKFTNATLAEMELQEPVGFDSIEKWGDGLSERPFLTIAKTFAIVTENYKIDPLLNCQVPDWKFGGLLMLDGSLGSYVAVMSGAIQLAQGATPEKVGVSVRRAIDSVQEKIDEALKEADEADTLTSQTPDSPSEPGSNRGQNSEETGTSSGD